MITIPVVCISGDGIGPEITAAMKKVVGVATHATECEIEWIDVDVGIKAIESEGTALPQKVLDQMRSTGISIKGPTATPVGGGHRSVNVLLRQSLELYANMRPIRWFEGIDTPIKHPEEVDLTIFRENTEDVYAGIEYRAGSPEAHALYDFLKLPASIPYDSALGIKPISEVATRRLTRKALEYTLASGRKKVTIVHKGNIMKFTEGAFLEWAVEEAKEILGSAFLSREEFMQGSHQQIPEGRVLIQDRIADAMFQDLLLKPKDHEVIVSPNLNGDYLSDASAALVGGLGLAPGANIGDGIVLFEAVHGTAPDIAGKDLANPSALILSASLMFDYLKLPHIGKRLHDAIARAIAENRVTGDLYSSTRAGERLTCSAFSDYLCSMIDD